MTIGPDTPRCGEPRRGEIDKQTGLRSGVGDPCQKPAGANTAHVGRGPCSWHGGCAPSVSRKYEEELAIEETKKGLARLGDVQAFQSLDQCYDSLLTTGARLNALVRGLEAKVAELQEVALVHPIRGSQVKAELQVYLTSVRVLTEVISTVSRLNLEEKKARIAQAQATIIFSALDAAVLSLGLPAERQQHAREVLARELQVARNGAKP